MTIQISPELELCGSITQGDWLDGYSDQYFVTNNGGGNYTIDQAILGGTSCETGGGLLFEVPVQKASGVVADALGSIEIEEVLRQHEAIADVAVVGLPDETWGEIAVAAVLLRPGQRVEEEAVRSWAKERIAAYKVPKRVVVLDDFPRNPVGKVVKPELTKLLASD